MKITELFVKAGLASSNKEAKRLINEGGARINDQVVEDPNLLVSHVEGHLIFGKWVGERFEVLHGLEPCSAEQPATSSPMTGRATPSRVTRDMRRSW
jgi:hypothetical protein